MNIPKPKDGEWLKLNEGEVSFVRVDYPHEYLKKLESAIRTGQFSAQDRLGLIRDIFDLAQNGSSPTTLALELAQSYKSEEDYTVWAELTGKLAQLDSLLNDENFYEDFKRYGREIYGGVVKRMGWEKRIAAKGEPRQRRGEKHTDTLLRGMALLQLGSFGDEETIKKAQELFTLLATSPTAPRNDNVLDPDLRAVVYNLVAENGGETEFNSLLKMYKDEDNQQEKDRIGRALGQFKIKSLLRKTLNFSTSKDVRFQNTLGMIASVWGNAEGRYLAWEFVKSNWKLLKERYAGGHYFTRVFGPAGEFTKISDAKDIESFVRKNPTPEAKRTIAQALEQIYSNAEWLRRDREKVKKFLERFEPKEG